MKNFLARCIVVATTLLAACGGDGGGSGPDTGRLTVTVDGLPAGTAADVTLTGPAFSQRLAGGATLDPLVPGTYTATAANVSSGGVVYSAASGSAVVVAGGAATLAVRYATVRLTLQEVANASAPIFATAPAGDTRLFVVERAGRIRILAGGTFRTTAFLDIAARVSTAGEGGLLSMAFDPDYANNGYLYVDFVTTGGDIAIERFRVSANPDVADPTPLRILTIPHPVNINHYGGLVAFGPDGMLYVGTGDGGGAGDPPGNARNPSVLLGKLLRIDVRGANTAQPYAVPADNPFAGRVDRRGEIWALGLRNPWRYAFDADTNRLYVADVGQDRREEIDVVDARQAGLDFGWNTVEGTLCYPSDPCNRDGLVAPLLDYAHDASGGCSITGGFVYRGSAIPALAGRYFYSDFCGGWLRSLVVRDGAAAERVDWNIGNVGNIVSFGRDGRGELYLLSSTGRIYRIVAA